MSIKRVNGHTFTNQLAITTMAVGVQRETTTSIVVYLKRTNMIFVGIFRGRI